MVTTNGKAPTLVVVQLAGGNDFMNTVIPYQNGLYYDYRPTVKIAEDTVLPINDELALNVPKLDPFFAIEEPPAVTEDAMFGTWYGPLGALRLTSAMRYSFMPDSIQTAPIAIVGHKGSWHLSGGGDIIKLTPDTMGLGPYELQLTDADDRLLLVTPEGDFEHDLPENRGE